MIERIYNEPFSPHNNDWAHPIDLRKLDDSRVQDLCIRSRRLADKRPSDRIPCSMPNVRADSFMQTPCALDEFWNPRQADATNPMSSSIMLRTASEVAQRVKRESERYTVHGCYHQLGGCAPVRRWHFGQSRNRAHIRSARRPESVCCASACWSVTVVVAWRWEGGRTTTCTVGSLTIRRGSRAIVFSISVRRLPLSTIVSCLLAAMHVYSQTVSISLIGNSNKSCLNH